MTDYIKREDAYRRLTEYYHHTREIQHESLRIALIGIPSADVAPVRHGRWYENDQDKLLMRIRCSICNKAIYSEKHFAYCPYCGARMDEEIDDE